MNFLLEMTPSQVFGIWVGFIGLIELFSLRVQWILEDESK